LSRVLPTQLSPSRQCSRKSINSRTGERKTSPSCVKGCWRTHLIQGIWEKVLVGQKRGGPNGGETETRILPARSKKRPCTFPRRSSRGKKQMWKYGKMLCARAGILLETGNHGCVPGGSYRGEKPVQKNWGLERNLSPRSPCKVVWGGGVDVVGRCFGGGGLMSGRVGGGGRTVYWSHRGK